MKESNKNLLYTLTVIALTVIIPLILISIPNYLRQPNEAHIPMQNYLMIVFIVAVIFLIGLPAGFHRIYTKDYSPIKSIWFFIIFGGIFGVLLGEAANPVMLIPYTAFMLIYAFLYKKFTWWKVALTTYLAGILIENAMNRSPIQAPTILWVAFFIYPYFITKIWENRNKLEFIKIIKDLKWVWFSFIILLGLTLFIVKSLPIVFIILDLAVPLLFFFIYRAIKTKV